VDDLADRQPPSEQVAPVLASTVDESRLVDHWTRIREA
jgi:hypothetical protein